MFVIVADELGLKETSLRWQSEDVWFDTEITVCTSFADACKAFVVIVDELRLPSEGSISLDKLFAGKFGLWD